MFEQWYVGDHWCALSRIDADFWKETPTAWGRRGRRNSPKVPRSSVSARKMMSSYSRIRKWHKHWPNCCANFWQRISRWPNHLGQAQDSLPTGRILCPYPLESHEEQIRRCAYSYNRCPHHIRQVRHIRPSKPQIPLPWSKTFHIDPSPQSSWMGLTSGSLYSDNSKCCAKVHQFLRLFLQFDDGSIWKESYGRSPNTALLS